MSGVLVASLIITIIAIALAVLLNRKVMETYALAVISIIAVLYCFGLINVGNCLLWGVYVISAVAVASCVYLGYKWKSSKTLFLTIETWQGVVVFLGLLLISVYVHYGRQIWDWDEFPHWGLTVKHMYHFGAFRTFSNENVLTAFSNAYPPGSGIFQYFFTVFSSSFVESNLYIAKTLLYFTLIMPFAKNIFKIKHTFKSVVVLCAFGIIPLLSDFIYYPVYSQIYAQLNVDDLLGLVFGIAILYYLTYKLENKYGIILTTASMVLLVLLKDMGFVLAVGLIMLIATDLILFNRKDLKKLLIPVGAVAITKTSWIVLLAITGTNTQALYSPGVGDIISLITGKSEAYHYTIVDEIMYRVIYEMPPPLTFSILLICLIFLSTAMVLSFLYGVDIKRVAVLSAVMIGGMALYQFALIVVFCFVHPYWQGITLTAHERYTYTYVFGMILFLLYFFVSEEVKPPKSIVKRGVIYAICVFFAISLYSITGRSARDLVLFPRTGSLAGTFHERYTAAIVRKWLPSIDNDKLYIIHQGDAGLTAMHLGFEFYPYTEVNYDNEDWSVGLEPYHPHEDNPWTLVVTPDQWEAHVYKLGYTTLYLYHTDDMFVETYGHFFPQGVHDDMLYQILFTNGKMEFIQLAY